MEKTEAQTKLQATQVNTKKPRETWIDVAKGLGVFMVFLGHMWYWTAYDNVNQMIYSIHIPMFFILSGFLTKRKEGETFWKFLKTKTLRLLLPTLIYYVCLLPVYFKVTTNLPSTTELLKLLFYFEGTLIYNAACWYFIVLFEICIVERLLNIAGQKWYLKVLYLILFAIIGYFLYTYQVSDYLSMFGFNRAVVGMVFVIFGMLLKDLLVVIKSKVKTKTYFVLLLIGIFIACSILWYFLSMKLNKKVSVYGFGLGGNYWHFLLGGIFGSISLYIFSAGLATFAKILPKWGENSLFIIGVHYVFVTIMGRVSKGRGLFKAFYGSYNLRKTPFFTFVLVIYAIVGIFILWAIALIFERYAPWILGKAKRKPKPVSADVSSETPTAQEDNSTKIELSPSVEKVEEKETKKDKTTKKSTQKTTTKKVKK